MFINISTYCLTQFTLGYVLGRYQTCLKARLLFVATQSQHHVIESSLNSYQLTFPHLEFVKFVEIDKRSSAKREFIHN